jgi:hypothetical protein
MYASLGLLTVAFITHGVIIYGWEIQNHRMSLIYLLITVVLNLLRAVIYIARIPERWCRLWFDIYGCSHQAFHFIVVFAGLIHMFRLLSAFNFIYSYLCAWRSRVRSDYQRSSTAGSRLLVWWNSGINLVGKTAFPVSTKAGFPRCGCGWSLLGIGYGWWPCQYIQHGHWLSLGPTLRVEMHKPAVQICCLEGVNTSELNIRWQVALVKWVPQPVSQLRRRTSIQV